MKLCDNCPERWDCYEPCLEVIAWKEIQGKENRIPDRKYIPKGIAPMVSPAEHKRLKSSWDNYQNKDTKPILIPGTIDDD